MTDDDDIPCAPLSARGRDVNLAKTQAAIEFLECEPEREPALIDVMRAPAGVVRPWSLQGRLIV